MQLRFLGLGLGLLMFASVGMAAHEANVQTTALSLLFAETPDVDLAAKETSARLDTLQEEVTTLFDYALTEEGKAALYQPAPVVFGQLMISFDKEVQKTLHLPANQKSMDLSTQKIGIAELDALNAKYGATQLTSHFGSFFTLTIPASLNPNRVAKDYAKVPGLRYAEANHLMLLGGAQPLVRVAVRPTLYRLSVGWGDCMAGCINNHRKYYEMTYVFDSATGKQTPVVRPLAESGDPLPADKAGYFR